MNPYRVAGLFSRVLDSLSYFRNLSSQPVAVALAMLARKPALWGAVWHAVQMDLLRKMAITGMIYAIVLAPDAQLEGLGIILGLRLWAVDRPIALPQK